MGQEGKSKGENFKEAVAVYFKNEKNVSEKKGVQDFLPSKDQGWKGVRKAASMGHLL